MRFSPPARIKLVDKNGGTESDVAQGFEANIMPAFYALLLQKQGW